jgi:hypothetical protein
MTKAASWLRTFSIVLSISFVVVSPAVAAEATGVTIRIDGKSVAGFTTTYRGETEAQIWQMLKQTPLTFERDFAIPLSDVDPDRATLSGQIRIETFRRGDPGTGTVCDRLELVRRGGEWFVADQDVDRTLKATGLPLPDASTSTPPAISESLDIGVLLVGAVLVLLIALVAFLAMTPRGGDV